MPRSIENPVGLVFDGDVWRATIGPHAANALEPLTAILLAAGRAREAGFSFEAETQAPTPETESSTDDQA